MTFKGEQWHEHHHQLLGKRLTPSSPGRLTTATKTWESTMQRRDEPLFCNGDIQPTMENQKQAVLRDIDAYDGKLLLNTPMDDLVGYFRDK